MVKYFDSVHSGKSYNDFCEDYFYLPVISGKLGFRKFDVIDGKLVLNQKKDNLSLKTIAASALKIASYLTPVLIIMIVARTFSRKKTFKAVRLENDPLEDRKLKPPTAAKVADPAECKKTQTENAQFLQKIWSDYKQTVGREAFSTAIQTLENGVQRGNLFPDSESCNLFLEFEDHPELFFLPNAAFSTYMNSELTEKLAQPSSKEGFEHLKNALAAAFAEGKKMVVTRFYDNHHYVAAAFSSDGSFKVIDSVGGEFVNIRQLQNQLNQAKILNSKDQPISFKGEYINTHLQRDSDNCILFASLYARQLMKSASMDAYREVNGAFASGVMQSFEDYQKIGNYQPIENLSTFAIDNSSFVNSWKYRALGLKVDDWRDFTLEDLMKDTQGFQKEVQFVILEANKFPRVFDWNRCEIVVKRGGLEESLDTADQSKTIIQGKGLKEISLRDLMPGDHAGVILIAEKNEACPKILKLQQNDIFSIKNLGDIHTQE